MAGSEDIYATSFTHGVDRPSSNPDQDAWDPLQDAFLPTALNELSPAEDPFSNSHNFSVIPEISMHTSQDLDEPSTVQSHRLLSFSAHNSDFLESTTPGATISAQLNGNFFLAYPQKDLESRSSQQFSGELTCYRRNLFQVTGRVSLIHPSADFLESQGDLGSITDLELVVEAIESLEGNPVKVISVPLKTLASLEAARQGDKTGDEVSPVRLNLIKMRETGLAGYPFQFRRLQFRSATANNGRRKELQQHFILQIKLTATCSEGARATVCCVSSESIVVRGRCPRNFEPRNDVPLDGKNHSQVPQPLSHTHGVDWPLTTFETSTPTLHNANEDASATASLEWLLHTNGQEHTGTSYSEQLRLLENDRDPVMTSANAFESEDATEELVLDNRKRVRLDGFSSTTSIDLYVAAENSTCQQTGSESLIEREATHLPTTSPIRSYSVQDSDNSDDEDDTLYEYHPLGLDDWLPPVDTVYRPHVVHHTRPCNDSLEQEKSQHARSKRYFSRDMG